VIADHLGVDQTLRMSQQGLIVAMSMLGVDQTLRMSQQGLIVATMNHTALSLQSKVYFICSA
jgi:hypothetical protein